MSDDHGRDDAHDDAHGDAHADGHAVRADGHGVRADGHPSGPHPPRLVYDDQCGFCTWCTEFALRRGEFDPVGFSELTPDQRARLPPDFETRAHLLTDDAVYSGGAAVEQVLARLYPVLAPVFETLRSLPGYAWLREKLYRFGADRRAFLGRIRSSTPPATIPE